MFCLSSGVQRCALLISSKWQRGAYLIGAQKLYSRTRMIYGNSQILSSLLAFPVSVYYIIRIFDFKLTTWRHRAWVYLYFDFRVVAPLFLFVNRLNQSTPSKQTILSFGSQIPNLNWLFLEQIVVRALPQVAAPTLVAGGVYFGMHRHISRL